MKAFIKRNERRVKRCLCLFLILLTGTFASFFGGSMSYALFYFSLAIPATSFLYLAYVYFRLKIFQSIETKITVKGEEVPYKFMLVNEDYVYFSNVSVSFVSDYAKINIAGIKLGADLPAKASFVQETGLICLYRGEFRAGVEKVYFEDFLGLFRVGRKYPSEMNMRVYPRIIKLNSLAALTLNEDAKETGAGGITDTPDSELREYRSGDDKRLINWRVSAKQGRLFTRKYAKLPEEKIEIFLDLSPVTEDDAIPAEDKILETAIAVCDYYLRANVRAFLNLYSGYPETAQRFDINRKEEFRRFYDSCLDMKFVSKINMGLFLSESVKAGKSAGTALVITGKLDADLLGALNGITALGTPSAVILAGSSAENSEEEELAKLKSRLGKTKLIYIPREKEIADVLEKP